MHGRRIVVLLGWLLLLVLFGIGSAAASEQRSAPRELADRLLSAPLPARDPYDLAARFRGLSPATPLSLLVPDDAPVAGARHTFWVLDQRTAQLFQTTATLRLVSDHAYWYVADDLAERATQTDLEQSANTFETRSYPLVTRYFGALAGLAVNNDPHIVVLMANVPGVAAYFSSVDAYPRAINPRSNERAMIYVNLSSLRPGQPGFDATLTHELQHMAQFNHCRIQEGWVDEGASELSMRVAGYESTAPVAFAAHPDTQLNTWALGQVDAVRHYQASYLFLRYVAERAGGWDALPRLFATCARGEDLFSAFLAREPLAADFDELFTDWTVANLVQDRSAGDGRYLYAGGTFHAASTGSATRTTPFLGSVAQYAANYIDLPRGEGTVTFAGDTSVALLGAAVDDGGVWWSNRADNLDSRLTRRLDLRSVTEATLRFKVWYDLEDQFDYVYVSVSRDGGRAWQVLPGQHTVGDDATGNRYGVGWTGSSGNAWVDEQVDLSAFAGSDVLLRFEYLTDQSFNGQGFALKDVAVDQIGLDEPGAPDGPWSAEGWVRVDGPVPERWNLRVVRWTPTGVVVEPASVDTDSTATFGLDPEARRQVLVIAPTAPRTVISGNYTVAVGP